MDNLNKWLTLLANVGVILGIVFLAFEIRLNTNMLQSQTLNSLTEYQLDFYALMSSDPVIAEIHQRGIAGELEAGSTEMGMFIYMSTANLRRWANEWYQYNQGFTDPEEIEPRLDALAALFRRGPGYRARWNQSRHQYPEGFQSLVDGYVQAAENQ